MIIFKQLLFIALLIIVTGCAGMNPNPGERTADTNWERGNYSRSLEVIKPRAEKGEPWAQLRLGIYYDTGYGVEVDMIEAIKWYKKAALQMADGKWAEGYIAGATGEAGYFGQKNDALIAQYRLAHIFYEGKGIEKDLLKAYLLINNVSKESEGNNIFFCCEWSGGRWFTAEMVKKTIEDISSAMTKEQSKSWTPENNL